MRLGCELVGREAERPLFRLTPALTSPVCARIACPLLLLSPFPFSQYAQSPQSVLVDVPAVTNLDHNDDAGVILNLVDDAVQALANSISRLASKLLASIWAGIHRKGLDPFEDSPNVLLWDSTEIFRNGLLEQKPISCHALSSLRAAPHT